MARFFYHLRDGGEHPDLEGVDLPNLHEARVVALKHAGEILQKSAQGGPFAKEWTMTVVDERGLSLYVLDFNLSEAPAATS